MTQINFPEVLELFHPLTEATMAEQWPVLHAGDGEPLPDDSEIEKGWLHFHNGAFDEAIAVAQQQGDAGASLLLKSMATRSFYLIAEPTVKAESLKTVVSEAEVWQFRNINATYQLAYALGRYGQTISVAKALKEGLAGQVEKALSWVLEKQPNHADAHTALAMYQAEIIGKLGKLAAKLTYGVQVDSSIAHFEQAIALAPQSVSALTSYADGLLLMFGGKKRTQAIDYYQQAAAISPYDVLSALDVYLAKSELRDI